MWITSARSQLLFAVLAEVLGCYMPPNTPVLCWYFLRYSLRVNRHQHLFTSLMLHKHSSIFPSTAYHHPSTTLFGYQIHPWITSIFPSLYRQPIVTPVTPSSAIKFTHALQAFFHPSIDSLYGDPLVLLIFGYLSNSVLLHKYSSIPPSPSHHDSCTINSTNSLPSLRWMAFVTCMNHHPWLSWFRSDSTSCSCPLSNFSVNFTAFSLAL